MWMTGGSLEEQMETGVIILVSVVALFQVLLKLPDHDEGITFSFGQWPRQHSWKSQYNICQKFQPWPNLRLTYLALCGRLPSSLFNSR